MEQRRIRGIYGSSLKVDSNGPLVFAERWPGQLSLSRGHWLALHQAPPPQRLQIWADRNDSQMPLASAFPINKSPV
ncbi:hypothetical protein MHYP_G00315040 [Metynnis hypsauchen]